MYQITTRTHGHQNARTDEQVFLHVVSGGEIVESLRLDITGRNDRDRGQTDNFFLPPEALVKDDAMDHFILEIAGDGAWLPAYVSIITTNRTSGNVAQWVSNWPVKWLSTDTDDDVGPALPAHRLVLAANEDALGTIDDAPNKMKPDPKSEEKGGKK